MKKNKERYVFLVLSFLWMAVIFCFSGQNGGQSGALSSSVSGFLHLPEWVVRKGAHMAEYGILGFLYTGFFCSFEGIGRWKYRFPFLISTGYAATDELHQMFSAGRTPALRDVCIDAAGAFLGILAAAVLLGRYKDKKGNERHETMGK